MICAARKSVAEPVDVSGFSCLLELRLYRPVAFTVYSDCTCTEIYIEVCLVMDTAEVPYQDIIYKYPYIVITAEFISYILSARSLAVCRMQEMRAHSETEPVIHIAAVCSDACVGHELSAAFIKHFRCAVERKELSDLARARRLLHCRFVVELHRICLFVVRGEVLCGVIIVVAVVIDLHQPFYIIICFFTFHFCIVEQICQRLRIEYP